MKKLWISVLAAFLLVVLFASCERANPYEKLTYSISGDEVTITDCDTSATSVTIPETIDGYPVTSIGMSAFKDCINLSSVNISNLDAWCKIDFFGSYDVPLYYGAELYVNGEKPTEVVFPDGITAIKDYTFYNLKSLKSITIPDSVTSIGQCAFEKCTSLTSVTIGNGVKNLGDFTFSGCTGLMNITIPDSVTSIGLMAFYNCTNLTGVTIGNGVTSIDECAFYGCTGLKSIAIPRSVTSIGGKAFNSVSSVYIYDLSDWCRISFESIPFRDHSLYLNGILIEQLILPSGISTISSNTFVNTSGIKSGCKTYFSICV